LLNDKQEIDDDEETLVDEEEAKYEDEPLEEGDQLFYFEADSFFEDNHITVNRCEHGKEENNRTNYDYVLKYDPTRADKKNWKDIVPDTYHEYEDIFTKKDFDKLPER
jgi:hypothetical protein